MSVISSVVGLGKEDVGVEGLVPRKGPACDGGEDSDPSSPLSSLLIVSGALSRLVISSGSRVLREIFSCRLSAAVKKQPSQDVLHGDEAEEELGLARLVSSYTLPHQNSQPGGRGRQTARSKVLSRRARDT